MILVPFIWSSHHSTSSALTQSRTAPDSAVGRPIGFGDAVVIGIACRLVLFGQLIGWDGNKSQLKRSAAAASRSPSSEPATLPRRPGPLAR